MNSLFSTKEDSPVKFKFIVRHNFLRKKVGTHSINTNFSRNRFSTRRWVSNQFPLLRKTTFSAKKDNFNRFTSRIPIDEPFVLGV